MESGIKALFLVIGLSSAPWTFAEETLSSPELGTLPEEVIITGDRNLLMLRTQMFEAEKKAYDVFNKFNDERRFNISCSTHQPTGSRINRQVCTPNFQLEATAVHGRSFREDYRDFLDPASLPNTTFTGHQPVEAVIASQQQEYRRKLKQVAEEQPEFLEALIEYSQIRERYEAATSTARK